MSLLDESTWYGKFFLDGWVAADRAAAVTEPATGLELGRIGIAGPDDVARAARRAAAAQPGWAAVPHTERAAVLRRAADLFRQHAPDVVPWLVRESGAVPGFAAAQLDWCAGECHEAAALPSRPYGELLPSTESRMSWTQRVPAGVVGVIGPFNAPLFLVMRSVAPALALGNAVILKPDPRTAVGGGVSVARVFEQAGLPPGLLHVLPGGAQTGEALITDPHVRVIAFTGSTATGRRVAELAGRHLKRVHLELGGKSALVVLDDADLDRAVSAAAWGTYMHQGQICMAAGRHLVHQRVYEEYVRRLAAKADTIPVGNPATDPVLLGPIIDERQRDRIHTIVTATVAAGARLAAGGTYSGLYYRPTVLADVAPGTPAFETEIFGPVAPVTPFATLDQAASLAASTEYGLSLGILTGDLGRGLDLAGRIPTGMAHINDQPINDEANAPFGGVGASGNGGRFGGAAANVEAFTETRWITVRGEMPAYPV